MRFSWTNPAYEQTIAKFIILSQVRFIDLWELNSPLFYLNTNLFTLILVILFYMYSIECLLCGFF